MVSCGSVLGDDGYATRVWKVLRAVVRVQGPAIRRLVPGAFGSLRSLRLRDQASAAGTCFS
jgi:hypothetical protein